MRVKDSTASGFPKYLHIKIIMREMMMWHYSRSNFYNYLTSRFFRYYSFHNFQARPHTPWLHGREYSGRETKSASFLNVQKISIFTLICSLSSWLVWLSLSCLNSSVWRRQDSKFSGETKSSATLIQLWMLRT